MVGTLLAFPPCTPTGLGWGSYLPRPQWRPASLRHTRWLQAASTHSTSHTFAQTPPLSSGRLTAGLPQVCWKCSPYSHPTLPLKRLTPLRTTLTLAVPLPLCSLATTPLPRILQTHLQVNEPTPWTITLLLSPGLAPLCSPMRCCV